MMTHNLDGGKVMFDLEYEGESFIDLSCLLCGKRWHVPKKNALARLVRNA